jgi:hypothetical protein
MNRYAPFHGVIPLCPVERGTEGDATGTATHARVPRYHFIFYTTMLFMICLHTLLPIFNGDFVYELPPLYKGYFYLFPNVMQYKRMSYENQHFSQLS